MAVKQGSGLKSIPKGLTVKKVKAAGGLWCITYPENGKQKQEWVSEQPTQEYLNEIEERLKDV